MLPFGICVCTVGCLSSNEHQHAIVRKYSRIRRRISVKSILITILKVKREKGALKLVGEMIGHVGKVPDHGRDGLEVEVGHGFQAVDRRGVGRHEEGRVRKRPTDKRSRLCH